MTIPSSKLTKLLDGVYECRDGQCTLREQGYGYKLMPSAKYSVGQFGLDVPFSTSLDIDERQMSVCFPFADGGQRDGVGDLLEVEGIDLSRHKKNPLVLWDHAKTYDKPIALAAEYNEETGQYDIDKYTVEIDPILRTAFVTAYFYRGKGMNGVEKAKDYEHSLFCEQIFDMMAKGLVRAGSIGYQVVDARELPPDYRTGTPKGLHLLKTLMLEASAVVLPANGDTVRKMLDMPKSCGKPLSPWLIKSLKPYAPERKAFMATGEKGTTSGIRVVIKPYRDSEFGKTYGIFDLGGKLLIGEFSSWSEAEKGADRAKYIITKTEKSYATNPLESRDDYENPLSDSDVPNAKWEPGLGAVKSIDERGGKFWVVFADGTERGPFGSEDEAMAIHRQSDLSAKGLRAKYRRKAMSAQTETTGGALRKPPATETKGYDETDTPQEAYTNGKNDCRWGVGKDRNPYKNSNLKAQWLRGWTEYNAEMEARYSKYDQKSMTALRKQYRTSKGLRRRLRKSIPGAASMHVSEKDMNAARKLAGEKGVKFERLGETKVKLIGPDEAIDEVAKAFGRKVKAITPHVKGLNWRQVKWTDGKGVRTMIYDGGGLVGTSVSIEEYTDKPGEWELSISRGRGGELIGRYPTLDAAKAAAESKYPNMMSVAKAFGQKVENKVTQETKTMPKVKTKALPEQIEETEEKDMDNPHADEPFGSQSLRHYRQKLMDDMAETEGHLKLQDHEPTKKILTKMQEHRADMLDEIESTHAKCYKDLPQFEADVNPEEGEEELEEVADSKEFDPLDDDDGTPADSDLQEEPTPEEVIEGMERAEEDEPDVDQVKRLKSYRKKALFVIRPVGHGINGAKQVTSINDPPIPGEYASRQEAENAAAQKGKAPKPKLWPSHFKLTDTSWEVVRKKSMEEDKEKKKHMCGKCAKAMEDETEKKAIKREGYYLCEGTNARHGPFATENDARRKSQQLEEYLDIVYLSDSGEDASGTKYKSLKKDYPIDSPVPEQAIEDADLPDSAKDFDLADHEKKGIGEAGDYLGDLGEPNSIHDDESRMKAYHYAKTLEGIGQIEEHAKESAGATVEDAEEAINNEGAMKSIPGSQDWVEEEADEPEHVKMCKGASNFLKQLSMRKDFGDVHREEAKGWHKRLKDLVETGEPLDSEEADEFADETGLTSPEDSASKTYEPGEMGEKDADEDDMEDKRLLVKSLDSQIRRQLEQVQNGQSMNLASWATGILNRDSITPDELTKLNKLKAIKSADDEKKDKEKRSKALGTDGPYSVDLQTFRSKPTVYFVVDSQGNHVAGPFKTDAQAKQEAAKLNANPNHKTIEPKEEDLKALAQSTQRNKSVLANLNRTLASLNGMI